MPRKTPAKAQPIATSETSQGTVKICFERIIPDSLDQEQTVRRELGRQMIAAAGGLGTLSADDVGQVKRMAVVLSKRWPVGSNVRCMFLDGTSKMQAKVRAIGLEWQKYADIKLKFVTSGAAEVRISFYADAGSWSAVGRDALNVSYFPTHQPTMNFGWLRDDTDDEEYHRVVTHEFGHALGCIHEHQSPTFDRKWNEAAVMKYFQGPPNYWKPDDIRSNVLQKKKCSPNGLSATEFDPQSIMLYAFDGALFSDGLGPTNQNTVVSEKDVSKMKAMYP